jgi:hypothetical protein
MMSLTGSLSTSRRRRSGLATQPSVSHPTTAASYSGMHILCRDESSGFSASFSSRAVSSAAFPPPARAPIHPPRRDGSSSHGYFSDSRASVSARVWNMSVDPKRPVET